MGGGGSVLRFLFGAVALGAVWLLFAGISVNHTTKTTAVTVSSTGVSKHWKMTAREKHQDHQDMDLNYVSKRRVPNGPDPIHNRRASKARQPPGRV